jgi:hypothetical protein
MPFAIGIWLLACRDRRRHAIDSVWMLLGTVLLMSPWWVRNWQVTNHFVPTTLQVGASLYDGLNPQATGASNMQPGDEVAEQFAARWQHTAADPGQMSEKQDDYEYQLDRYLRQAAVSWALEHPRRAWQLAGVKLLRFWNVWPNEPQFRKLVVRAIVFAGYAPLICLAVYGGWRLRQRGWPTALLVLPAVYLSLLHMIFVSSIRYRQGALISLSVLAAAAFVELWRRRKRT